MHGINTQNVPPSLIRTKRFVLKDCNFGSFFNIFNLV